MDNLNDVVLVGIDYSINSPAMSIYSGDLEKDKFELGNIEFFAYVDKDKFKEKSNKFIRINDFQWNNYIERWNNISDVFLSKIHFIYFLKNLIYIDNIYIVLEGYSFGSNQSLIFNIAENTAILKNNLYNNKLRYKIYQPASIKKFITGKGNANKELVYDCICKRLNINLSEYLNIDVNKKSPIYDFSDSLSILFMLYCEMLIRNDLHNKNVFDISKEEIDFLKKENKYGYSIFDENFILPGET